MNAIIFTEGGKETGFGHALRCAAIKRAFERLGIKTELIVKGDESVARVLGRDRYTAKDWQTGRAAGKLAAGADIALVDSYLAGGKIYRAIAAVAGHCLYLDDCARLAYPAGTVVNYNAYGPAMRYPRRDGMRYLLGTAYAPLRKEFMPGAARKIRKDIRNALLVFGGADTAGLTSRTLEFLAANYPEMEKTVIAGGAAARAAAERLKDKKTKVMVNADASAVRRAMLGCDIAFTAGGVTLYELARTGTPAIGFCVAANQKKNLRAMAKAGALYPAGLSAGKIRISALKKILARAASPRSRKLMSAAGIKVVDGLGAVRVAKYARTLLLADEINVRRAVPGDVLPVFRLSNEPAVRECSINTKKIALTAHKKWFAEKLGDPSALFLIAEHKRQFAGQVRFALDRGTATLSISVAARMRGLGAGRIILRKALETLEARYPKTAVLAYVKRENTASRKLFETGGFKKIGEPRAGGSKLYLYRYSGGKIWRSK